jgi:hypothetical protein
MRMDLKKYFSYYSQKMMISPYYFGPPVLIDPVEGLPKKFSSLFPVKKILTNYFTSLQKPILEKLSKGLLLLEDNELVPKFPVAMQKLIKSVLKYFILIIYHILLA